MNDNRTYSARVKQACAEWIDGDWSSLLNVDLNKIDNAIEASFLAALVAGAHLEFADIEKCKEILNFSIQFILRKI